MGEKKKEGGEQMLFVMIGRDGPGAKEKRLRHRAAHLEGLQKLADAGRVTLAGPFTDRSGSLIVFEAESLDAAKAVAEKDPYVTEGIFESYELKPFKQVFPKD